jgi:nitroimidazol reductase NimA-like FMN-containing flavoprotein (pyridoxamine 5'-phosphate oxidase superfamily)
MPRLPMTPEEVARLLSVCDLVNVAFDAGEATYLIPLGCVWLDGALYGVTEAGRKTEIAAARPRVAFQADTSRTTGMWEWESVTGQGRFQVVEDAEELKRAMAKLGAAIAEAPEWWKAERAPEMAAGRLLVWRIEPASTTGVRYARPE